MKELPLASTPEEGVWRGRSFTGLASSGVLRVADRPGVLRSDRGSSFTGLASSGVLASSGLGGEGGG